jgi:hypothetical protein
MALKDFVKTLVQPGQPLSAQLWNDNVEALGELVQRALAVDTVALSVTVQGDADPMAVRVTAVDQATHLVYEAVRPVPPRSDHTFAALKTGTLELRAEAPGFTPAAETVQVAPSAQPQTKTLTLARSNRVMPAVFGMKLRDAIAELAKLPIVVDRVLDVTGGDEPPRNPSPEGADAVVLAQLPAAAALLGTGNTAQLVIAVVPRPVVSAEVPDLTGMTVDEARRALEAKGLQLGTVTEARRRVTGSTSTEITAQGNTVLF